MSRSVLILVVLFAVLLTAAALFLLGPSEVRGIGVRIGGVSGRAADKDSLLSGQDYYLQVEGQDEGAGLVWMMSGPVVSDVIIAEGEAVPAVSFNDPGWHTLRCIASGELVAMDSVRVTQGDLFAELVHLPSMADTVGAELTFMDASQNVDEREWTLWSGGGKIATGDAAQFTWTPADTGTYTLSLEVKMRSGAEHSSDIQLTIGRAAPVVKASSVEVDEGPSEAELAEREARRRAQAEVNAAERARLAEERAAAKRQREEEERARKAREEANKPPPPTVLPSCWNMSGRPFNSQTTIGVGSPGRGVVTWKKGVVEFEMDVRADCRLTGFKAWANASAGSNTGRVTLSCISECKEPNKSKSVTFRPVYAAAEASTIPLSSLPVMLAGNRYRVTIDTGDAELGFFTLQSGEASGPVGTVTFRQAESSVFDLVFKK